ncbi:MAG TPA: carboxypeptidase-like regulatory domain-containing protein [Pyrinomonadaceae bacterium]|nr:carboxypeptidase-like regulatory domain-containing protein [Pyrinomonadaceae bacterium]
MFRNERLSRLALSLCLAAALLAPQASVFAQSRNAADAALRVTVYDPTGALVAGARVRLRSKDAEKSDETGRQGEAAFSRLRPGEYQLTVEAEGFEAFVQPALLVAAGANQTEVRLEVAAVSEEVTVSRSEQEKKVDPQGPAFSNILTEAQIAQLPDDPEELEQALNTLAGPGATIRVNGFRGGKLPPKSHIKEIRFRLNPYAAENHETGFHFVDITTKPGLSAWHGTFNFGFRDEALNARPVFAPRRNPEQQRRFGLAFDGPLWRNRTSFFFSADANAGFDTKSINAALPEGILNETVTRPSRTLNVQARAEHALNKTQMLRLEYQRNASRQNSLGIGDHDMPERAYTSDQAEHVLRAATTGPVFGRYFNELRFQARTQAVDLTPAVDLPTVIVNSAFNRGGAQLRGSRRATEFELAENFDIPFEKHSMRAGLLFEFGTYESDESRNYLGTFQFASLEDFVANRPTTYSRRTGDPALSYNNFQFGWYWQDDFRVRKDLTLSYGVRHEMQTHLGDRSNFAPRLGFAWSPLKSGKVTLRGGAGLFYDWFTSSTFEQTVRVDGVRQRDLIVTSPGFPDPLVDGDGRALPPSRIQSDPNLQMPYVLQSSVGMETQLFKRFRFMTDYQFQRGVHLLRGRNINAPLGPGLPRPDPTLGNVTQIESSGNSTLHRVMFHLSPAMLKIGGNNWFWNVHYRWQHHTSDTDGPFTLPANNFDLSGERGPTLSDMRHHFSALVSRKLMKNLSLMTIISASSARPYNVTTGRDDNGDTVFTDRPAGLGRNSARGDSRVDVTARLSYGIDFGGARKPDAGPGSAPRAIRIGPDGIGGMPGGGSQKYRMEFYASATNLLNTANLSGYSGVQTSPFFGQPTSALPGRRIETGFRFSL